MANVYMNNFGGDGTCVVLYTHQLTAQQVEEYFTKHKRMVVCDCCHVEHEQLQYYCIDERAMLTEEQEQEILDIIN